MSSFQPSLTLLSISSAVEGGHLPLSFSPNIVRLSELFRWYCQTIDSLENNSTPRKEIDCFYEEFKTLGHWYYYKCPRYSLDLNNLTHFYYYCWMFTKRLRAKNPKSCYIKKACTKSINYKQFFFNLQVILSIRTTPKYLERQQPCWERTIRTTLRKNESTTILGTFRKGA